MKPLFQTLAASLTEDVTLKLVIRKTADGTLTGLVDIRNDNLKDQAQDIIQPLTFSGTPAELDEQFADLIVKPFEKTSGIITSMADYEKAQELAEKAKAENKAKADERKKKAEALDKAIKEADKLAAGKKTNEAVAAYKKCLELADDKTKKNIEDKLNKLLDSEGGLFGDDEPVPTPDPTDLDDNNADDNDDNDND